jgi:hypothetical protein
MGPSVIADLDTLLLALYVELTDRIIPTLGPQVRAGPGRPPKVRDAELVCLAVAQVLLRYNDEHHWLRAAAWGVPLGPVAELANPVNRPGTMMALGADQAQQPQEVVWALRRFLPTAGRKPAWPA